MTAVLERPPVPRVFHRIKLDGPLTEREREYGESWLRHHPGWELRLWTAAALPPLTNQALFDAAPPGQREDLLRYELLLAHGGVFLATDLECLRNIEPLLNGVDVFCAREDGFRLADGVIGAVPGHPLVAAVVAALPDSVAWRPGRPRAEQTGPELLTRVVAEQDALGRVTPAVFGSQLFYPYHWTEPARPGESFPGAYAVCHWLSAFAPPAVAAAPAADPAPAPARVATAAPTERTTERIAERVIVDVDPDLVEPAAVVLAGAMQYALAAPGLELALVVKGVPEVTAAVGDAMAGLVRQLAGGREVPDVVVYGEPEGRGLPARARLAMSDDPAVNARSLLALGGPAAVPPPPPAPPEPPAPRGGMRGTYIGRGRMLVDAVYGAMLVVPSDDYSLMPSLVTWGAIEPPLTRFLAAEIGPGQTFVDVGANIGYFTVLAAQRVGGTGRVIAFEANPVTAGLLRDNLAVNWLTEHDVTVRGEAAFSSDTTITFNASAKWVGDSSIRVRPGNPHRDDRITTMEVPAVRLDDALRDTGPIDILKIDIEGGEYHAFLGMMGLIRARRIRRIVFEWNAVMLGEDRERFADLLGTIRDECGGRFFVLDAAARPAPVALGDLTRLDFYPFAVIDL